MKHLVAFILLVASAVLALAGQVCTLDPPRPAGATGTGFYVAGGKLFDPTGAEFRIRGVNSSHPDASGTPAGLPRSGANTARMFLSFTNAADRNWAIVQSVKGVVPIPTNWSTTCKADAASLSAAVDAWVAQAPTWTQLNRTGLINIANEWGPTNDPAWRDGYLAAIARMRAAGYTGTLIVDTGGCGQDSQDVVKYGPILLATDPQHNLLFSLHVYGSFHQPATATWMQDYATALAQLKASGLPILIGEFGPGKNLGPSPTLITPETVVGDAEANGWGWMAWAWDANNLANCMADDSSMSMTVRCGAYTGADTDLTSFGREMLGILKSSGATAAHLN